MSELGKTSAFSLTECPAYGGVQRNLAYTINKCPAYGNPQENIINQGIEIPSHGNMVCPNSIQERDVTGAGSLDEGGKVISQ